MNIKGIIRFGNDEIIIRDTEHYKRFMFKNKHLTIAQLKEQNERIAIELDNGEIRVVRPYLQRIL